MLENTHFQDKIKEINLEHMQPYFQEKIAIVFSVDENYIDYLCVTLESLKAHSNTQNTYDIIILYSELSEEKRKIIITHYKSKNFKIRFLDMKDILKLFDNELFYTTQHFTIANYYRIFTPDLLFKFDKVVYCDCDAIFLDDVAKLYNINLEDKILAAVKDIEIQRTHLLKDNEWAINFVKYLKNTLKLKKSKDYFQSGFLIFNIQKCLEFKFLEKCIEALQEVKTPIYADQCILNKVAERNVKFLDFAWNVENHIMVFDYFHTLNDELYKIYKNSLDNAKFLHFSGCKKPWQYPQSYNAYLFWHYARQTPFYEEILFKNINDHILKNIPNQNAINNITHNHLVSTPLIKGAVEKIKTHLSYKLGQELLSIKNNKFKILILPLSVPYIILKHKFANLILNLLSSVNPNLKTLNLEQYPDYKQSLQIKNYLSYRLGNTLVKHPFTFIFRASKVYKEWKREKGR